MALFGGAVGSYTTPDGRVVQLPAELAGQFPALQPAGPPPGGLPPAAPDPMTPLPLPAGGEPAWTPDNTADLVRSTPVDAQPVTSPVQVPDSGGPARPAPGPATSPAAVEPGPSNAPVRKPLTDADIGKMGVAGPENAQLAAGDEKRAAVAQQGQALADQATAVGNAMAATEAHAQQLLEQRQQEATRRQAELDRQTQWFTTQAQKIANTKIDRSADHPILAAIGIALSTLGTAMQNRDNALAAAFRGQAAPPPVENPGLKAFYAAIDRKVAAQMADLDNQRAALQLQGQGIGLGRQAMQDRLTQMDVYRAGYLEQAKQQVERIKQQTQSPIIKANTDVMLSDISREQADTLGNAQQRWQTHQDAQAARAQALQMHRESLGVQIRGQNLEQNRFEQQLAATREERAAALAEKLIDAKGAAGAAQAKLIGEQAIVDPSTGDFMLTPAGQRKMQQADAYEAQARKATEPAQAQKLTTAAQQLRDSAQMNDVAVALNKKGAEEAQKTAKIAQDMTNNVDAARRMLQGGPEAWNRDQWAQIKVALQGVKVNYAQQMGERMSPKALDAIDEVLSIDTDSITSRTIDKSKALAALKTVEDQIDQSADVALKSAGVKSGWTPAKKTDEYKFSGKTAAEMRDARLPASGYAADNGLPYDPTLTWQENVIRNPGIAAQREAAQRTNPDDAYEQALGRTNAKGQSSNYGLKPEDDDQVRAMIKRAGSAGNAEYDRIATNLASPLTSGRPGLAIGMANLIRDEDPKLFESVLSKLPPLQAQELNKQLTASDQVKLPAPAVKAPFKLKSPADLAKYNEYLRSIGLPEVAQ